MHSIDSPVHADLWTGDALTIAKRFNHDLRSPLGAISTSAELLREMLDGQNADLIGLAAGVETSALRSVELVNRVVALLRASYGDKPESQPVSLGQAVDRAMVANEPARRLANAVIVKPAAWPEWNTVEEWIVQVWSLLLSNAIKHGGKQISLGCEDTDLGLRCWVRDDGSGLSVERASEPFPAFESLHEKSHLHGFGLPLARRLLELLGATFGYSRRADGFTEFSFTLPRAEDARPSRLSLVDEHPREKCAPPHFTHPSPESLLLDLGPAEREFDTLLSLVRRLLNAPLAFVSLLQKDGHIVMDGAGLHDATEGEEALRSASLDCAELCRRVMDKDALLQVAKLQPSEASVVRSFLGVPVHGLGGSVAGCLAVGDMNERHWSEEDQAVLHDFALLARKELRLREKRSRLAQAIQRLREDEALNHSLLESTTDCIKLLDPEGRLLDMNGPGRCIMEVDDFTPLEGHLWTDLWPEDSRALARAAVVEAQHGRNGRFQAACPTMKGTWKWWDVVVTGIQSADGALEKILSISRDITAGKQAELTAQSNEQLLRKVLDSIMAFVGVLTPDGIVVETNAAARSVVEVSLERLMGNRFDATPWWKHSAQERKRVRNDVEKAASGSAVRRQATVWTKDGSIDVDFTLVPVFDATGGVAALVWSCIDLTPRIAAERAQQQSESRLSMLADNMSQFAWITEANGDIFWYNKRWFDYTGTTLEQMRGWGWRDVHHPDHIERVVSKFRRCLEAGEPWEDTFPLRAKDGTYRWFLSRAIPIRDASGQIVHWFGTNTDITEQRGAEEALRKAAQAKDDFIAVLSHELRTPLNPVLLIASAAGTRDDLPEDIAHDFDVIRKNVEMEARLIDDLLDMTRVLRGKLPLMLTTITFDDLMADVLSLLRNEAMPKRITVNARLDARRVQLQGDEVRLRQIMWNIMRNAVKFTPAEGTISVTTSTTDSKLVLVVADTGIGMTAEEIGRIFEPFAQGDHAGQETPGRFGGLGLGLAIAKLLAEQHGGRIGATSQGRHLGTEVTLELPLSSAVPAAVVEDDWETAAPSPALQRALRILLIEDHDATRETLALLLRRRGHRVVQAESCTSALQAASVGAYDLLMSDIGLPDGRGDDLLIRLRLQGFRSPAIALSGYGMESDVQRSREAGFAVHLIKPVSVQELDRALAKVFAKIS